MGKDKEKKKDKSSSGGSDLRNKFKKQQPKIADLKKKQDEENQQMGYSGGAGDYLEISEGSNKFRFFPPHDGSDFFLMVKKYWMDIPDEDGNLKRRTVHDSILHNGTKFDIVQEYIKFVQANCKDKSKLEKLTHWQDGLSASSSFVAYALKLKKDERNFGLLEFNVSVRNDINKAMFVEDEDDPIEVDPYTDVDDGLPILLNYIKSPNKKKKEVKYSAALGKKAVPLTDEELEVFNNAKPLKELYRNNYGMRDFDKAVEGLQHFDDEKGYDLFDDERWIEIMEKVKAQYEDDGDDTEKPKKDKKKEKQKEDTKKESSKKSKKVEEEEEPEEKKPKKDKEKKPKEEVEEKPKKSEKKEKPKAEEAEDEKPKKDKKGGMTMEEIRAKLKK